MRKFAINLHFLLQMSTLYLRIPLHEDPVTKANHVEIHFFTPVNPINKIQIALLLALPTFKKEKAKRPTVIKLP